MVTIDFETYSECDFRFNKEKNKWESISKATKPGLPAVGSYVYAEHESTQIVCLAYDLHDGSGVKLWLPIMPPPFDLFLRIARGDIIEAHNAQFEYCIWENVSHKRLGWPRIPLGQFKCSKAKARAWGLPGSLKDIGVALGSTEKKDNKGTLLINKFSKPKNPTKKDSRLQRNVMTDEGGSDFFGYCIQDVKTEKSISSLIPELTPQELEIFRLDQIINNRGIAVDTLNLKACKDVILETSKLYTKELQELTDGRVKTAKQVQLMLECLKGFGLVLPDLSKDTVKDAMENISVPPNAYRLLELRTLLKSSSVLKVPAIERMTCSDGRLRGLFEYYGAKTARFAGRGPQPQNLPNSGPWPNWGCIEVEQAFRDIQTKDLKLLEDKYGNPLDAVSGCLRGLFISGPGQDLICSDFSAIEAVVLAEVAGEEWRKEVFRTHGKIYEMSASKISGVPFQEFVDYKERTGDHHPLRKSLGKVAELASGYQGWVAAWKKFGADKYFNNDEEIKQKIIKWREDSPNIVKLWKELEKAAIDSILNPGRIFYYRGTYFQVRSNVMYCGIESGREIAYHEPRVTEDMTPWGKIKPTITFMGYNSDATKGAPGWTKIYTHGGKLTENVVQALSRDILCHAMLNLEKAGYKIVLHVHDEICCEVPAMWGSVLEFEKIMSTMPDWCLDWPIKASGGWRGKRYKKD